MSTPPVLALCRSVAAPGLLAPSYATSAMRCHGGRGTASGMLAPSRCTMTPVTLALKKGYFWNKFF
uniref:Uncharacterized protein n=1 Tax=Oryza sativa subsp. japonica TaxID=39947 RepID=Q7EY21_ORYSJ|nr:hypothetical protein [Oryza sativa Japonica Group]